MLRIVTLRVVSSPASFSSGSDVYQHEGFGPMPAAVCLPRSSRDGEEKEGENDLRLFPY